MKDVKHSITHGSEPEILSRYYNLEKGYCHLEEDEIIELGRDFLKWATQTKKAYKARKFFRKLGWGWSTLKNWKDKYPEFREIYNEGKEEVGDRREELALERKLDSSIVSSTLRNYDQEYQAHYENETEFKAKLTNDTHKPVSESKEYIFVESFAEIAAKMEENK